MYGSNMKQTCTMNVRTKKSLLRFCLVAAVLVCLYVVGRSSSAVMELTAPEFNDDDSHFNTEFYSSVNQYLRLNFGGVETDLNAFRQDCRTLANTYRYLRVTAWRLKTFLRNCKENIVNGSVSSAFFKEIFQDFEGKCPKQQKFLIRPRSLVALASYPGSGNTWSRELIQTVTGIHTGSVYSDWNFEGSRECPSTRKIFIAKTHRRDAETDHDSCRQLGSTKLHFSKAIVIIRNPFHALLAEFNRQTSLKSGSAVNPGTGIAVKEDFLGDGWERFLIHESNSWMKMARYWLLTFTKPVHVLVYEQIQQQLMSEMFMLTQFLDMTVPFNSLYCLSGGNVGNFQREKPEWMIPKLLYNITQRKIVNENILKLADYVKERRSLVNSLTSYLMPEVLELPIMYSASGMK